MFDAVSQPPVPVGLLTNREQVNKEPRFLGGTWVLARKASCAKGPLHLQLAQHRAADLIYIPSTCSLRLLLLCPEVAAQLAGAQGMAQLAQRPALDLAHPFARHTQLIGNLLQGVGEAISQSIAQAQDTLFAW